MTTVANWLPELLGPHALTENGGDPVTARPTWNFIGATLVDDSVNERTDVTFTGVVPSTLTGKTLEDPTITGTVTYQGTKLRILSIPGEVQTTTATTAVIAQFTMVDETCCTFDFTASMAKVTTVTKAGRWDGKVTYRRTGGGAPAIVGAAEYGTAQETTAGDDVAFSVSGNIVRVLATAADGDDRNWTCELRAHETLATV